MLRRIENEPREFHKTILSLANIDSENWNENEYVPLNVNQIKKLKRATCETLELVQYTINHIIKHNKLADFNINPNLQSLMDDALSCLLVGDYTRQFSLGFRLDFKWNGVNKPTLVGIGSEVPKGMIECAIAQKDWSLYNNYEQCNFLEESILDHLNTLNKEVPIHFSKPNNENNTLIKNIAEMANRVGLVVKFVNDDDITYNHLSNYLMDESNNIIDYWFRFGEWDSIFNSLINNHINDIKTVIVEPPISNILNNSKFIETMIEIEPSFNYLNKEYDNEFIFSSWIIGNKFSGLSVSEVSGGKIISMPHIVI